MATTVAAYYFGNYHPGDARNARQKGPDWTEWKLVREAKPRFPGHRQPRVPLWGYGDESDPAVMARKIDAAADHGVDVFLFDWYAYEDGFFLDGALDRGFLAAPNRDRMKFALMWANHDWTDIHPARRGVRPARLYPGAVTPARFHGIADHVITRYFPHPAYWRVEGRPYFSIYDLNQFLASFGGVAAARQALEAFRSHALMAGVGDIHLNAVAWGKPILPGERVPVGIEDLVGDLGFDSATSYVWVHHVSLPELVTDYDWVRDRYLEQAQKLAARLKVPYYPNVSIGWDPSPRCHRDDDYGTEGYPFSATIGGDTPARFGEALRRVEPLLETLPPAQRIVTVNSWNEWTEGSYLEPDTRHGMEYLEALRATRRRGERGERGGMG